MADCMNSWVLIISNHFMHVVFSLKMMRSLSSVHWLIMGKMLQSFTGAGLYNSLWHLLVTGRLTWHHHLTHPQCVHASSLWLWADRQRQTEMHCRRGDEKGEQVRKPGRGLVRHRVHSEVQLGSWCQGTGADLPVTDHWIVKMFWEKKTTLHHFEAENLSFL